jgi:cell division transport system permease protein
MTIVLTRITRPIKEAFYGFIRHFSMSFSSMIAVTVTLLLISLFLILSVNVQEITQSVQDKIQIHVQLEDDFLEIADLSQEIESLPNVLSVTFSSKDVELDAFIASYGEDGIIFEMYRGENNPLKNALIVELSDNTNINTSTQSISNMEGVLKANYGGDSTLKLVELLNNVQEGGLILVLVLGLLALVLIVNTIKITIQARSVEIQIMRTIGASNLFIQMPFVLEGIFIGLFGALIPIILTIWGYAYAYNALGGILFTELFPLRAIYPFVLQLSYLLMLLGMILGLLGSYISVARYLRGVR